MEHRPNRQIYVRANFRRYSRSAIPFQHRICNWTASSFTLSQAKVDEIKTQKPETKTHLLLQKKVFS